MSTASVVRWTCDVLHCDAAAEIIDKGQTPLGWLWVDVRTPKGSAAPIYLVDVAILTFCPAHGAEIRDALPLTTAAACPQSLPAARQEVPRLVALVRYPYSLKDTPMNVKVAVEAGSSFHVTGPCDITFVPASRDEGSS